MVAGRVVQGAGGGIFPLAFSIIRDEFPREKVSGGIGLMSSLIGVGGGAGVVLAGVIVSHLSYHWLFWLPLVVDRRRGGDDPPLRARVADQGAGEDQLGGGRADVARAGDGAAGRQPVLGLGLGIGTAARARWRPAWPSPALWVAVRGALARAARRHADDARARRVDDQRRGGAVRRRHVLVVRADPDLRPGAHRAPATGSGRRSPKPGCSCCRRRWSCCWSGSSPA